MLLLEEDLLTNLLPTLSGRWRMVDLTHNLLIFLIIFVFFQFKVQKGTIFLVITKYHVLHLSYI